MTFPDLNAPAGPPIRIRLLRKDGFASAKGDAFRPHQPRGTKYSLTFDQIGPVPVTGRTAGSENVTVTANYEGQSAGPGGLPSEKPSRRVGKSHRKDPALGRKMSLLARNASVRKREELRPQVEICHFSKHQTGRNLSPPVLRAGRMMSPFGTACRVGKRHF